MWSIDDVAEMAQAVHAELTGSGAANNAGDVAQIVGDRLERAAESGDDEARQTYRAIYRKGLASYCGSVMRRPRIRIVIPNAAASSPLARKVSVPTNVAFPSRSRDGRKTVTRSFLLDLTIPQFYAFKDQVERMADTLAGKHQAMAAIASLVEQRAWADDTTVGDVAEAFGLDIENFDLTELVG